jgi:hypothetical protein
MAVHGLKYSSRGGKGRESNLVRPSKHGSVEPFSDFQSMSVTDITDRTSFLLLE